MVFPLPDRHSKMLNVTSRLAVKIKHIPEDISWTDTACQRTRSSLSIGDILPGSEEGKVFYDRAMLTVMELLVSEFKSLKGLKQLVPSRTSPHPLNQRSIIPLKLLFHDEKCTGETILILQQLIRDAALDGTPQVS